MVTGINEDLCYLEHSGPVLNKDVLFSKMLQSGWNILPNAECNLLIAPHVIELYIYRKRVRVIYIKREKAYNQLTLSDVF